jgi:hypothetical protein
MANRTFANNGFWDRIEEAIKDSGMSKVQIAEKMGVERKSLYPKKFAKEDTRSWHSGRLAAFCKVTGVSADWLLGLSRHKGIKYPKPESFEFKVIDPRTGKEPIFDHNHVFKEKWFKNSSLIYCDISGWAIDEYGYLMLVDDCDNIAYPPSDRFKVVFL